MRTAGWLAMGLVTLAMPLTAAGEEADLSTRSRALAAKSLDAPHAAAPFLKAQDPLELFPFAAALESPVAAGACGARMVCYDARHGSLVYRGARGYMPQIGQLTPEGVALRHDRVILRYSFR